MGTYCMRSVREFSGAQSAMKSSFYTFWQGWCDERGKPIIRGDVYVEIFIRGCQLAAGADCLIAVFKFVWRTPSGSPSLSTVTPQLM